MLFPPVRRSVSAAPLLVVFLGLPLMGARKCGDSTVYVSMRDGVSLATDVYSTRQPAPTVLFRTPYGREGLAGAGPAYNDLGYALVAQDLRGFGGSQGNFLMFTDDGWGANKDGYDTVEWVASNSWSNGDVCLSGASALGITTILGTGATPPHLRCAFALVTTGDLYHHLNFWGGAFREEMVYNWLVALGEYDTLQAVYTHYTYDEFWAPISIQERYEAIQVPLYSVGGWYDILSQGNLDVFSGAETAGGPGAQGRQKVLMGPWSHQSGGPVIGELTFPSNSVMPAGEDIRWFDHWLKGVSNGVEAEPPVKYYLMGDVDVPSASWNVWRTADAWPVPADSTPLYLLHGGGLGASAPADAAARSGYTFNPAEPVPTLGGNNLVLPAGPYDQRPVESRPDVLVFTSGVLTAPLAITGRVTADLWVASSAVDTDFTVKLTDVYPDGRSMLLLDGILRMRFREGVDREVFLVPGQVYPIEVDLWSTAHVFNQGHRIRVAISSSNATRFSVNPNTGGDLYEVDPPTEVADQTLYHDASHPSRLNLPVVPLP